MSRRTLTLILAAVLALAASNAYAARGSTTYPNSMDALGDSITRGFNTCSFPFTDCTQNSWATGTSSTVNSFYSRLLKLNRNINGRNYNDAVSGAKMTDLPGQASNAVSRGAQLVTIDMGSNDACTSSVSTMTTVADYQSQFTAAMNTLTSGLPSAQIRVGSLPDAYQLWVLFHTNSSAVNTWNSFGICQSLLANATSTAQAEVDRRAQVRQREIDFNSVLQSVCAQYTQCKFDNNAGFNTAFKTTDVSTRDYFHPSVSGQALIASTEWPVIGY